MAEMANATHALLMSDCFCIRFGYAAILAGDCDKGMSVGFNFFLKPSLSLEIKITDTGFTSFVPSLPQSTLNPHSYDKTANYREADSESSKLHPLYFDA